MNQTKPKASSTQSHSFGTCIVSQGEANKLQEAITDRWSINLNYWSYFGITEFFSTGIVVDKVDTQIRAFIEGWVAARK